MPGPAAPATAAPPPPAMVAPAPPSTGNEEIETDEVPPGSLVWHRWLLFDPHVDRRETYLAGGPLWERPWGGGTTHGGFAAFWGHSIETTASVFLVRMQNELGFRLTGGNDAVVTLSQPSYGAGLRVGPVDLTGRVGVSVVEIGFGARGFGLGFLSPIAEAGASFTVGPVRVGARIFSEYSWRWVNTPSTRVQGLLVEVALGAVPPLPRMYRVEK